MSVENSANENPPYRVETQWKPLYGRDLGTIVTLKPTLAEAVDFGLRASCLAGIITVQIYENDVLHCDYNRNDNMWRSITDEAKKARGTTA